MEVATGIAAPGVYGIRTDDLALRNRVKEYFVRHWGNHSVESGGDWTVGAGSIGVDSCIASLGGSWIGCDGEPLTSRRLSSLESIEGRDGELASTLRGNVFVLNQATGELRLECHESGYLPLFWFADRRLFLFSSSLRAIRNVLNRGPDPSAVVAFLRNGYTIGESSPLKDVRRMRPGQVLRYRLGAADIHRATTSQLWTQDSTRDASLVAGPVDSVWSGLVASVEASYGSERRPALMLSGGWDSRTLLAATLETGRTPHAYVHGDPDSREISLVQRIARAAGVDLHVEPIGPGCLDPDWLDSRFGRSGSVVFPHWHRAAEVLADRGTGIVASGVFGEVLGGHYGPSMALNGWRKIVAVAHELVGPGGGARSSSDVSPSEVLDSILHPRPVTRSAYLRPDWWNAAGPIDEEIRAAKEEVLSRYLDRGIHGLPTLVEAYITEHRGAQYIAAQPGSMRSDLATTQPFVESELLRLSSWIPIHLKIHNSLNRLLIKRYAAHLASLPLAATLVRASRPVVVQEASRLARRIGERLSAQTPLFRGLRRLSWVNFEFMRDSPAVLEVIDSLTAPWWDRAALRRTLDRLRADESRDLHPYFDQLMKIYTIDALFREGA